MTETINLDALMAILGAYAYRCAVAERKLVVFQQELSLVQHALTEARAELDAIHHPRATA